MVEGAEKRRSVPLVRTEGSLGEVTPERLVADPRFLREFKTERTRRAEEALGIEGCLYFYVGHACPDFGDMVFVYDPTMSARWKGTATPFDTGGIIGYIHADGLPGRALDDAKRREATGLSDEEKKAFRHYIEAHRILALREWQPRFEAFIATYFASAADYVRGNRPDEDDETGRHHHRSNDRRAWTWEIQAHRDHPIFEGLWLVRMSAEKHQRLSAALEDVEDENNPWWRVLQDRRIFPPPPPASETKTEVCGAAEEEIASWV